MRLTSCYCWFNANGRGAKTPPITLTSEGAHIMSQETAQWLNTYTLIGNTDQRGTAWHYRAEEQGDETNHYTGFIPIADVQRRLFDWEAQSVPVFVRVPADFDDMTGIDENGAPYKFIQAENRQAIYNPKFGNVMGVFRGGYVTHQFGEWLLDTTRSVVGDSLGISSAGLLKQGAQAWVEYSLPETLHNSLTGFDYRPNLLAATSHDGSIATTMTRTINATVCDNTLSLALGEAGLKIKVRHSRYSGLRIGEAREALALVEQTAGEFEAELEALAAITVTDQQLSKFLDAWAPLPGDKGAARTRAERKRDQVVAMYRNDARANTWQGTALGIHQAVNTWSHHVAEVRGRTRQERNMSAAISGEFDALAAEVDKALAVALA